MININLDMISTTYIIICIQFKYTVESKYTHRISISCQQSSDMKKNAFLTKYIAVIYFPHISSY